MLDFKTMLLRKHGFIVGDRDPNVPTPLPGRYMVHYPDDYCIVGDDLTALVDEAVLHFDLPSLDQLHDWQGIDPEPKDYVMERGDERIDIAFETGEHVWIEKQDGRIRVHCFHPGNDAPVNVEIYGDRIEIDRHDHDAEA